jgi:rod shape-determining protein MreC
MQVSFHESVDTHFEQAQRIKELKIENEQLQKAGMANVALRNEIVKLSAAYSSKFVVNPKLVRVSVISYAQIPEFRRLWIDYQTNDKEKIYGLIYPSPNKLEPFTAGIAVDQNNKNRLAILNSDSLCSYTVVIGASMAPGIAMGKGSREMIVRFIPYWMDIKVGDEVTTSGLDTIFYPGIKVGRVKNILNDSAYKEAIIDPYYQNNSHSYFYLIEKL